MHARLGSRSTAVVAAAAIVLAGAAALTVSRGGEAEGEAQVPWKACVGEDMYRHWRNHLIDRIDTTAQCCWCMIFLGSMASRNRWKTDVMVGLGMVDYRTLVLLDRMLRLVNH